jgi:hypothetical protein
MKLIQKATISALLLFVSAGMSEAQFVTGRGVSFDFANVNAPIAGVAADEAVVFVGEPLNASVVVLARLTGQQIAELPPPPSGFVLPFIMHIVGPNRLAVRDPGGLPQPAPFVPVTPSIYEYTFGFGPSGFVASLTRTISFASVLIGFPRILFV